MGLFDDTASSKKGEVRIGVPDDEKDNSKLRSEVESKIDTSSGSSRSSAESSSGEVSRKELHRQNERIINLLEKLVDDDNKMETSSNRITDRESGKTEDDGMRGGMDELL